MKYVCQEVDSVLLSYRVMIITKTSYGINMNIDIILLSGQPYMKFHMDRYTVSRFMSFFVYNEICFLLIWYVGKY